MKPTQPFDDFRTALAAAAPMVARQNRELNELVRQSTAPITASAMQRLGERFQANFASVMAELDKAREAAGPGEK